MAIASQLWIKNWIKTYISASQSIYNKQTKGQVSPSIKLLLLWLLYDCGESQEPSTSPLG